MCTMDENFYEAAIRHWVDGCILEAQEEYDNAVCMQGFAAECALKAILGKEYPENTRRYGHRGKELFVDIEMILLGDMGLTAMLDPASGMRLSRIPLPDILFDKHPERRYYGDKTYSKEDAEICRTVAERCIKVISGLRLDGYL